MKNLILFSLPIILAAGAALASDVPQVEVFGGYSVLRLENPDLSAITYLDTAYSAGDINISNILKDGFSASFTYNATPLIGIEADFRYNSGNIAEASFSGGVYFAVKARYSDLSILAGPRLSVRRSDVIIPFAHALVGISRAKIRVKGTYIGQPLGFDAAKDMGLGLALGGGVDVKVNKILAVRLIQADYYLTKHEDETWNNAALSFGIVFRFGGK